MMFYVTMDGEDYFIQIWVDRKPVWRNPFWIPSSLGIESTVVTVPEAQREIIKALNLRPGQCRPIRLVEVSDDG